MLRYSLKILNGSPDGVVVGFSGGRDSICAAHILHNSSKIKVKFLAHFNHGLHCDDEIERKAIIAAEKIGAPIVIGRAKSKPSGSLESWCRQSRYEWFDSLCENIVVAHHLGDVVESYVMNMLRMQSEYKPIPEVTQRENGKILRPFIISKKTDIQEYSKRNRLEEIVHEDPYNSASNVLRVKIRKMVKELPSMERGCRKRFYSHLI